MSAEKEFIPLKSSNLDGAHYDPESKALTVKFKSGGTYTYAGVSQAHYDALISADSPGSYLHRKIRSGYDWTKAAERT
jgi:hypothetical protein